MKTDTEQMIQMLRPEISKKCDEIKEMKRDRDMARLFILMCFVVISIPTIFVFMGVSVFLIFLPVVIIAPTFLVLASLLLNQSGGVVYEQA